MLVIENLKKHFQSHDGQTVKAIDDLSVAIKPGKVYTLLGPSGCGKTTTLRSIAGLEKPSGGLIKIGNRVVFDSEKTLFVPPNERAIGMVFQSYAIWPHMNVFENVAFPLQQMKPKPNKEEIKKRVAQVLETVHLGGFENRPSTKLSGGQQQRLALARAIIHKPNLLLLDEPLSNLDAKLREIMRFEIKKLQKELGITTVFVTHDQSEALALSDEIVLLNGGKIIQQGTPKDIYQNPKNQFVADFIGSSNFLRGVIVKETGDATYMAVKTKYGIFHGINCDTFSEGAEVMIAIRPENVTISIQSNEREGNQLKGTVSNKTFLGDFIDYIIKIDEEKELRIRSHPDTDYPLGEVIYLRAMESKCVVIPA